MQAGRSVGAKCDIAIDDAVTHADVLDVFANGFDYPGGLVADDRWKGRDRKRTSTIINVDEVETYDGVADQCFIVARLTHDDVLEPQDFGRTIFVNTGDSRGGWHDISPSKRQRSSFACSQSGAKGPGRTAHPPAGSPRLPVAPHHCGDRRWHRACGPHRHNSCADEGRNGEAPL